jgi:anti-anti-sigma factor
MHSATAVDPGPKLLAQTVHGITIAELTGELDIAAAPVVREELLSLLRPSSSRLVIDLSNVSFADATGLAVLVSTARRARLLGGFLHLAALSPPVLQALQITGLHRSFAIFSTVQDAAMGHRATHQCITNTAAGARSAGTQPRPASRHAMPPADPANASEVREAVAALLTRGDAWRNADPRRQFTPALRAMGRACDGTDDAALYAAARSMLVTLARHPLTHSPAVAATATRLRQVLNPASGSAPAL